MILHKRPANINMAFARPLKVLATVFYRWDEVGLEYPMYL